MVARRSSWRRSGVRNSVVIATNSVGFTVSVSHVPNLKHAMNSAHGRTTLRQTGHTLSRPHNRSPLPRAPPCSSTAVFRPCPPPRALAPPLHLLLLQRPASLPLPATPRHPRLGRRHRHLAALPCLQPTTGPLPPPPPQPSTPEGRQSSPAAATPGNLGNPNLDPWYCHRCPTLIHLLTRWRPPPHTARPAHGLRHHHRPSFPTRTWTWTARLWTRMPRRR
jgi:hypothetical protein